MPKMPATTPSSPRAAARPRHHPLVVNLTKARASLGKLVGIVHRTKQPIVLEKSGLAVAYIGVIDDYEDFLDAHDPDATRRIAQATNEYQRGESYPADKLLEELRTIAAKASRKKAKATSTR